MTQHDSTVETGDFTDVLLNLNGWHLPLITKISSFMGYNGEIVGYKREYTNPVPLLLNRPPQNIPK